jgi:hypothetical protein
MRFCVSLVVALVALAAVAEDRPVGVPEGYKLQYEADFSKPDAMKDFVFTDSKAWRLGNEGGAGYLELFGASEYKPKHRSPLNIALLKGKAFGDVVLDLEVCSTVPVAPNQDMIFVCGFQSPTKFYYCHVATKYDGKAHHNCFIVNDADRAPIGKDVSGGVNWGTGVWHKVRIDRRASDGTTKVYFDDMTTPVMRAEDKTFGVGLVGVGSFDDKAKVRSFRVYSPAVEERKDEVNFKPLSK